jgi:hypothetical protein
MITDSILPTQDIWRWQLFGTVSTWLPETRSSLEIGLNYFRGHTTCSCTRMANTAKRSAWSLGHRERSLGPNNTTRCNTVGYFNGQIGYSRMRRLGGPRRHLLPTFLLGAQMRLGWSLVQTVCSTTWVILASLEWFVGILVSTCDPLLSKLLGMPVWIAEILLYLFFSLLWWGNDVLKYFFMEQDI